MEYKEAGVDIGAADQVKKEIKMLAETTYDSHVLAGVGPFGALYDLGGAIKKYQNPVLVSSMDGLGTKLIIAKALNALDGVAGDLVNHCVNDILCQGARPLFYLDYIAQDKFRGEEVLDIIRGKVLACKENGLSLIGGETAQMPDIYRENILDVVGTIIGIAEKDQLITGKNIKPGDIILGLPSTGPHSNGYSLIRKIFIEKFGWSPYFWLFWVDDLNERLGRACLAPHKSYLRHISLLLNQKLEIKGLAHITGGGLPGNIIRVLPEGCQALIQLGSWPVLPIFQYIQKQGNVPTEEMYRVFNMSIGMALIVSRETSEQVSKTLWENKEPCYIIGEIIAGEKAVRFCTARTTK